MSLSPNPRPVVGLVLAAGLSLTACSSGDPAATPAAADPPAPTSAVTAAQLTPAEFAGVLDDEGVVVVNVHVPDEGSIAGTDATIPYDEVQARSAELPQERSTPLAVYCRSGAMSAEAVGTLQELGYTDVIELRGGMNAWVADGRELLPPAG